MNARPHHLLWSIVILLVMVLVGFALSSMYAARERSLHSEPGVVSAPFLWESSRS